MTSKYDDMMKSKNFLPTNIDYLPPKIIQKAQDELKEVDEIVGPALEKMRKLINAEKKFKCPMEDEFLLLYLRARKFDVKKSFVLLQNMFDVKKSNPELYRDPDPAAIMKIAEAGAGYYLPYRDPDGCAVLVIQFSKWDPEETSFSNCLTALTALLLYQVENNPISQISGVRILVDVRGFSLRQMRCFSPRYIHLLSRALKNCLPIRFKGIHFFNESSIFQYVWSVLKLLLTEKIRNRVHFHGDNQKNLHKHIPKDILHAEFGGDNFEFDGGVWCATEIKKYIPRFLHLMEEGYEW